MANVYIWENVEDLTYSYHSSGGLVIIADTLEEAMVLARTCSEIPKAGMDRWGEDDTQSDSSLFTTPPTRTIPISGDANKEIFLFPNAGCC